MKGSRPKVKSAPGRKSASYSGYVLPATGELIVTKPNWFNFETVIESYREFLAKTCIADGRKILMVIDNAPWHKKAKRLIWDVCDGSAEPSSILSRSQSNRAGLEKNTKRSHPQQILQKHIRT